MQINIYSSGKEREGGYSGSTKFCQENPYINVSHCGTAAVVATFHKMYILTINLCNNQLTIEYVAYDDCEDYKIIKQIIESNFPDKEKANQFKKMVFSKIKIGKNFKIEKFIDEVYEMGIEVGKKQKITEIKQVLSL